MVPRLKVFTWSDGFHAFTVATSSRPKALLAWGVGQDLFATGLASELSGGPDYEAARASPGEVIERGLAVDVGTSRPAAKPRKRTGPTKAQRERVVALEADLERLDTDHQDAVKAIEAEIAEVEKRREAEAKSHKKARTDLVRKLKAARSKL